MASASSFPSIFGHSPAASALSDELAKVLDFKSLERNLVDNVLESSDKDEDSSKEDQESDTFPSFNYAPTPLPSIIKRSINPGVRVSPDPPHQQQHHQLPDLPPIATGCQPPTPSNNNPYQPQPIGFKPIVYTQPPYLRNRVFPSPNCVTSYHHHHHHVTSQQQVQAMLDRKMSQLMAARHNQQQQHVIVTSQPPGFAPVAAAGSKVTSPPSTTSSKVRRRKRRSFAHLPAPIASAESVLESSEEEEGYLSEAEPSAVAPVAPSACSSPWEQNRMTFAQIVASQQR